MDLTDQDRWLNHPDQAEKLLPRDRMYINVTPSELLPNDVVSYGVWPYTILGSLPGYWEDGGKKLLILSQPADGAIIQYATASEAGILDSSKYVFLSNTVIEFTDGTLNPKTSTMYVTPVTYGYSSQHPAKIINKTTDTVVADVPIWNPVRQQYHPDSIAVVDYRQNDDPARYSNGLGFPVEVNFWHEQFGPRLGTRAWAVWWLFRWLLSTVLLINATDSVRVSKA